MNILLPSDVFPPGTVGGAAWSAYTLARALIAHGHQVTAVVPVQQPARADVPPLCWEDALGVPTLRWHYAAPRLPFIQNYYRHERLWQPFAHVLATLSSEKPTIIHAQHVQTAPAAVLAGRRLGVPVVVTVRDHWPWDYFATGLHGNRIPSVMPPSFWVGNGVPFRAVAHLMTDLVGRLGAVRGVLALPAIPYMLAHMRRRAALLAQADAVIAVSNYIARRLRLTNIVQPEQLHVIPNMGDTEVLERIAAMPLEIPLHRPFLLYVGKLEVNKGAALLVEIFRILRAMRHSGQPLPDPLPPLIVVGSGPLQATLKRDLSALGVPTIFPSWLSHDEVLRLMARCDLLLFPSIWGEPLSRVLIEASLLGAPIVAMPTGGTPDIISDGVNGVLAATPEQFAHQLARLLCDGSERQRLGANARRLARERFAVEVVLPRILHLYEELGATKGS